MSSQTTRDLPADRCLDGRTALVTGASAGTGLAIAATFARAGALVVMLARTREALDEAASGIGSAGGRALVFDCDITDSESVRSVIDRLPVLDIVVNNAGTNVPQPFVEVSGTNLDLLINLNMRATFVVSQAAVRKMLAHPHRSEIGGSVINITSQMGHVGSPNRTAYCMTKHGLEGLTKAMAIELAPKNIRVNSLAPTFVDTPLIRRIVDTPAKRDYLVSRIPMGRMATECEIAAAALYLASGASSMVTGTSLRVDGGWTAQ